MIDQHAAPTSSSSDISVLGVISSALRRWRLLVGLPVLSVVVVILIALVWPRSYTAWAAFTPESNSSQLSTLAGVAAEFGVNIPTNADEAESPQFYADMIGGQTFLEGLVREPYVLTEDSARVVVRMDTVLDVSEATPAATTARGAELLDRKINAFVSPTTGVVKATVTLRSGLLARAVLERALTQIQTFNATSRQSRARWERAFIEERLRQAGTELAEAEDRLGTFLVHNRDFSKSPQLQFESDRLQRVVSLRQEVLETLSRSLEQAKIDEVKASPVLTIVEPASVNPFPDRRHLLLKALLAFFAGLTVAALVAIAEEYYGVAVRSDVDGARRIAEEIVAARLDAAKVRRTWAGWRRKRA
ncbi:MAG TPA: hypothetical protein VH438_07590 [Gemmatimonadales bacterium]|jgi:uncharacterized protein involved in exopolysaccharide biosynthesis